MRISLDESKDIQLNILKSIHAYCEKEKLVYVLGWGTLLGAVRHNGFIPWDDDIDILMPRKDYEQFVAKYSDERYGVVCNKRAPEYHLPFAKVIDSKTILKEDGNECMEIGVYVDIFPIDYVPKSKSSQRILFAKTSTLLRIIEYKIVSKQQKSDFVHRLLHSSVRAITRPFSVCRFVKSLEKVAQSYWKCDGDNSVACLVWDKNPQKRLFKYQTLFDREKHTFEGNMYYIPHDYDMYLRALYGDYMTPPPTAERESHHLFEAYWR